MDAKDQLSSAGLPEDLHLGEPVTDATHAEFVQLGGRIFVRDLNSTNGTYVNGARIDNRDVPLRDGDRIRIGTIELRLMRRWNDGDTSETAMLGDTATPFKLDEPAEAQSDPGKTHIVEPLKLPPIPTRSRSN